MPDEEESELTELESVEALAEECDEVAEALAVHSIISEERHGEIIQKVEQCQLKLETLSSQSTAESPILSQLQTELAEVRAQLTQLKASLDLLLSRPPAPPSSPQPQPSQDPPPAENPEEAGPLEPENPVTPPAPAVAKQRRLRKI